MKEERRNRFIHKLSELGAEELDLLSQMLDSLEVDNRQDLVKRKNAFERLMKSADGIGLVQMKARDSLTLKEFPIFIQGVLFSETITKVPINSSGQEYELRRDGTEIHPCLLVQEIPDENQSLEYLEKGKSFYIGDTFFYMASENLAVPDIRNRIIRSKTMFLFGNDISRERNTMLKGWYYNFLRKHKDLIVEISE